MPIDPDSIKSVPNAEILNAKITELGSLLHEEWCASRKKEDGSFEPRPKKTKDQQWIDVHHTDDIDIANTSYKDLPEDWKGENKISAEDAIGLINERVARKDVYDSDVAIEDMSAKMHDAWLQRNGSWAPPEQNKPYAELSDEEKDKDRAIIKKALEIYTQ